MKQLLEGNTYPFDAFPLEGRIDLLKASTEVYYCLFTKNTPDGKKYGLFRNNLKGDGLESRITDSYTAIGDEFGYDEVQVCPTGIGMHFTFSIFLSLVKKNAETCDLVTLDYSEGAHILFSKKTHQECSDALKEYLGMSIYFCDPDYFNKRKQSVDFLRLVPSSDVLFESYDRKYEFMESPNIREHEGESFFVGVVKKKNGKYNYFNFTTGEEFSPVDFDERCSGMSLRGEYMFKINGKWIDADWDGVLLDYRLGTDGWYSYDCLPDLLAGKDISRFKQDEFRERRKEHAYIDPNKNNPDTLYAALMNWAAKSKK